MTDEVIEKIYLEDYYTVTKFISNQLYRETPEPDIEDIFSEAISEFLELTKNGKFPKKATYLSIRKYLYGILKFKILEYKKNEAQIQRINEGYDGEGNSLSWADIVDRHVSNVILHSQDVNYEREKQAKRTKDPTKRRRDSDNHKKHYYEMKKDPAKWQAYLNKVNERKRRNREEKKKGIYTDKRLIENKKYQ